MVATESKMIPLGTIAPFFSLFEPKSKNIIDFSNETHAKGYLVAFICNHCPYVVHIKKQMTEVFNNFTDIGIHVYAISSNDPIGYPDDSPDKMAIEAEKYGFKFPYLFDDNQEVAKSYNAACTPDFYIFNQKKELYYRGQFDDSRPNNGKAITGFSVKEAVKFMLEDKSYPHKQIPSIGCNIKWK